MVYTYPSNNNYMMYNYSRLDIERKKEELRQMVGYVSYFKSSYLYSSYIFFIILFHSILKLLCLCLTLFLSSLSVNDIEIWLKQLILLFICKRLQEM